MQELKYSLCVASQAHNKVPDDAWEYQTRKSLNDAAYKGLDYVPYSSRMPVRRETDETKFMWVRAVLLCMYLEPLQSYREPTKAN